MRRTLSLLAVLALALGLLPPGVAQASFPEPPLVLHELTPCVLFDTRPSQGGTGALAAGEARTFHVVGSTSDFASQGGTAGGCGIPGFSGGDPQTEMVFLNLVAVDPAGGGNLKVWATDVAEPSGGVVNYQKLTPNLNIANALVTGVRKDVEGNDITVKANVSSTHVRGVALGYLTLGAVSFWSLAGNSGTDPSVNFVGTTDDTALELRVNDARALRLEPNATSPNVIGGFSGNNATAGVIGATIGGGGVAGSANVVTDDFGTVGGGENNQAGDNAGTTSDRPYATVGGGESNDASFDYATVGGGELNTASGFGATVGGGGGNTASGNRATVGGGVANTASDDFATVGGGLGNDAAAAYATIAGGGRSDLGDTATRNRVTDEYGTIGGGGNNQAGDNAGTTSDRPYATVGGGLGNTASGPAATVAGGENNQADGNRATVAGGSNNTASGFASFTAGFRAKAFHDGAFVWADSTTADFQSTAADQFSVRAGGGVRFVVGANTCSLDTVTGAWTGSCAPSGAAGAWLLSGNAGTDPANDFVGTTDNTVLNFRVNDARALRLEPNPTSPNVIGGFSGNNATAGVVGATIGGGGASSFTNRVTDDYGTVGGGRNNRAGDNAGTTADIPHATVGGGQSNTASGFGATVGGGTSNIASGPAATVPGGTFNTSAGNASFAAGTGAKANHDGAFVWGDSQFAEMASSGANQFIARAAGGFFLQSDSTLDNQGGFLNTTTGAFLSNVGVWTNASDAALKTDFTPVDPAGVLDRVADMPITSWSYRAEPGVVHMGPTAQDFQAAFGLGSDDETIGTVDADGVALAAIQGLHQVVEDQQAEIAQRDERLARVESKLASLDGAAPPGGLPAGAWWGLAAALGLVGLGLGRRWGRGLPA